MKFDYQVNTILTKEDIFAIREEVNKVKMSESLEKYIIELVSATRRPKEYKLDHESQYIQFGASPRASINLNLAAKAMAYFEGRDYVLPEDIKEVALDVMRLSHRLHCLRSLPAEQAHRFHHALQSAAGNFCGVGILKICSRRRCSHA